MDEPSLRRELTTTTLSLYGVGVMVGAGIYVLIGQIVAIAGAAAWLAFLTAAVAALPTGLAYAELASRYPRSAGEAVFAERAFAQPLLTFLLGFLIFASGVTSVAAVSHGFADYAGALLGWGGEARVPLIVGFLVVLTIINHRGIRESTWINTVCTVLSVGALLLLIAVGVPLWAGADLLTIGPAIDPAIDPAISSPRPAPLILFAGAALAFYAFIGFEDICNVADEVRSPSRTIPRAILISLTVTALIYVGVAITAVAAMPPDELAASPAPLAELSRRLLPGLSPRWLTLIALLAVSNTALFNLIMGSRMLWGMGRDGVLPPVFARVHAGRRTPTVGILATTAMALACALTGVLQVLAEATNVIILLAFFLVNLCLLAVRIRGVGPDDPSQPHFRVPIVMPALGLAITGYLVAQFSAGAYLRAGALLALGALLYLPMRARGDRQVGGTDGGVGGSVDVEP